MKNVKVLAFALLLVVPAAAQDAARVVFVPAKQIDVDIHRAPTNDMGESEINLIERTPDHAGILMRRTAPGKAEVHETETDVWCVIDGGADFVTGGSLIGGAQVSPGQTRGSGINGGEERKIAKGDFIRVPAGVPHWVKKIDGKEIVYIVVKFTR